MLTIWGIWVKSTWKFFVLILLLLCKSDMQNKIPEKEKDASQVLKNGVIIYS